MELNSGRISAWWLKATSATSTLRVATGSVTTASRNCFDCCVEHAVFPHGAGHVHHQRDGAVVLVVVDEVSRRLEGDVIIIVVVVVGPEEFSLGIGPG